MLGIGIVSGMAKGIDTNAHMGAMCGGGKTIAVLGCGFNKIFPKENEKLFYQILEDDGTIISEYEPDAEAESKKFIERNRIVSGISLGVLVIEATIISGTSTTAKFAREENRTVFAIPHNIDEKLGKGTNVLLQKGAKCVVCSEDIINSYTAFSSLKIKKEENKIIKKIDIPIQYQEIYECIENGPANINIICKKTGKNIVEINSQLTLMELEGLITQLPGNVVRLTE